jgi:D-alanyl-lipoteichoic acid acyltransferase DltB (MBOAT superfamily)
MWDWRFLFLLTATTLFDFTVALFIQREADEKKRKRMVVISVLLNIVSLGYFKYFNFFIDSFLDLSHSLGFNPSIHTLNIILPVGISFYTFHSLSYIFDVYRRDYVASKNIVNFLSFVSFFPLLVAGPIERAAHLLPQIENERKFSYRLSVIGLRLILWGLFKKMVIADNAAIYVDDIFDKYDELSGSTLVLGIVYFAIQIYGDFSGYSDIALGSAYLFGFEVLRNFNFPYFSRDIAEFWRRWHISLSSWFRDYLYIPLGGSKGGLSIAIRNTMIIFLVSGFWHGANWTYLIWGALNALYFLPLLVFGKNRQNLEIVAKGKLLPSIREFFAMATTFGLTCFAWIFFRSPSLDFACNYIGGMLNMSTFTMPQSREFMPLLAIFILLEWVGRERLDVLSFRNSWVRRSSYVLVAISILCLTPKVESIFIYFQF